MYEEGTAENKSNKAIKREKTGKRKEDKKETEPNEKIDRCTAKRFPYADKKGKDDEMGTKIAPNCQK